MAKEFVTRHGLSVSGKTYISTVDLNVNANSILVIDGNEVQYRDVSSLPDTFVTGGTLNSSTGTATFTNNTGGTFNVTGFFTSGDTINIYNTDSTFTSERFADLNSYKLHLTGGTIGVNTIEFVPTDIPPTTNPQGQVYFNSSDDTLVVYNSIAGTSLQVGQETWYKVKNQSGQDIPDGVLVMSSGTDGNSGRITIVSGVTDGSYPNYYIMGVTTADVPNGENGWVTAFGEVRGIDTTGQNGETWIDGTILYSDPTRPGGLTNVKPLAPNNRNSMAIVLKASSNGSLFVRPGFSPNLEDLITGATNGQVITFNGGTNTYEPQDPNNIYNNNGTLDSDRIVNQDTNHLTFSGDSGVSIGTGTTSPVCALLELASENQGLLIPRMTQTQRQAIPSPLPGLLVYCTDNTSNAQEGLYMYKSLGWVNVL